MPHTAYIALGSNLGKRQAALRAAIERIGKLLTTRILTVATFRETSPVAGPPDQGLYINGALAVATDLTPHQLLDALLSIEHDLGRDRTAAIRNAPRTIDLDILLYDDRIIDEPGLTVPHPRMHERLFVLEPLAEIAPSVIHPLLKKSIGELLDAQRKVPS